MGVMTIVPSLISKKLIKELSPLHYRVESIYVTLLHKEGRLYNVCLINVQTQKSTSCLVLLSFEVEKQMLLPWDLNQKQHVI